MANKQFILVSQGSFLLIAILALFKKHRKRTILLVIVLVLLMHVDLWIVILEDSMAKTHLAVIVWILAEVAKFWLTVNFLVH